MVTTRSATGLAPLTPLQWLICGIAALGFAFDSYELLMLPLIVRPALAELLGVAPNSLAVNEWVGTLLYVPAVAGGIFGLLGGYLTDLFGRRRVLVWSILLYAFSAFAAGYATSVEWLLFWRCCTFVGVCVEFVAAVAWLSELFADPKQRERVVGYTQAFGSIGGLMVTGAYYLIVTYGDSLPEVRGGARAVALYADVGRHSGDPAHRHPSVPPGIPGLGGEEARGHAQAPELCRALPAAVPPDDDRHDDHDGVRLRRRVRRDSADAAHRPRAAGAAGARAHGAGADDQRRPVVSGVRRSGRTAAARRPRGRHRQPAPPALSVPGAGTDSVAARLLPRADRRPHAGPVGHLPRGDGDDRAVQFLGKLPAARVPDPSARHRRKLCGQRRRPHDRHVCRAGDDARSWPRCRAPRCRSSWPTRRRSSAPPRISSASSRASGFPSRSSPICPIRRR